MIREIDAKYWDATSTYGYGGPLVDDTVTTDELDIMLKGLQDFLYEEGCVSLFMRLHPIINKERERPPAIGKIIKHGLTVASDLTKSEEVRYSPMSRPNYHKIKIELG